MERTGGCLCGAVRYTATLKGERIGACHCGMCRKWAGGPLIAAATTAVRFEPSGSLKAYASSAWAERGFCGTCGSNLFYRLTGDGRTHLAAGTLDDLSGLSLSYELFVDKRPDAYRFAGELKGLTEAQVMGRSS